MCCICNRKILMVFKKQHDLWQIPQGGINNGETPADALRRELLEELGTTALQNIAGKPVMIDEARITFPAQTQNEKTLMTDTGQKVDMKGKHYFFCITKLKADEIIVEETEFDDCRWFSYLAALGKANQIYQSGKRRITVQILQLLKREDSIE